MSYNGIIIRQVSGFYDVLFKGEVIQCKARGIFRKNKLIPLVGDKVLIDKDEKVITSVLPRKNQFKRPAVSNIDFLGIVVAPKDPAPDMMLIDKLIISALLEDIEPMLVINKIDLAQNEEIEKFEMEYSNTGYKILKLSCKNDTGFTDLNHLVQNGIFAFAGQSGVGKSSILNKLCKEIHLEVGDISSKTSTGKHTTTHAQIITLRSGGLLVDTPGFSVLEIENMEVETLQHYYSEFIEFIGECRFRDCLHELEPGCKIKTAVEDNLISRERYGRYLSFLKNLKDLKERKYR